MTMGMHVVVIGYDPERLEIVGPFKTKIDADQWGTEAIEPGTMWWSQMLLAKADWEGNQ
jgi:hypothetical protein